jgi:hypothetical protein
MIQRLRKRIGRLPFLAPTNTTQIVPSELRGRFFHLYMDIAWYGLLAGSTIAFLGVYAARIGASAFEIGLLSAGPAMVNLLVTIPAGRYLQGRPIGKSVFASTVLFRSFYLLYALLPLLLPATAQIPVLVWATLLMTIPGVTMAIGFNALFAAAVPPEWRGYVTGRRNALISAVYVVTSLVVGQILIHTPQEIGYAIVFGIGFLGAAMSTVHVAALRNIGADPQAAPGLAAAAGATAGVPATSNSTNSQTAAHARTGLAMRAFAAGKSALRVEVLRGPFGMVLLALFSFHLAQFMPGPLMPLQWVQNLHFSDNDVAIGTAFFHGSVFFGSLQLARLTRRYGNHRITVVGAALLALYPLFTALMPNLFFYILTSIAGGQAWALVGGAMGNYLLEKVPAHDRPAYLAWYNIALNLAILLGTMLGPLLAAWFDIQTALILIFFLRLGAAGMLWIAEPRPPKAADDPRLAAQA